MAHKFAFIMDPLENVLVDKTDVRLYARSATAGARIYFLGLGICWRRPQAMMRARRCEGMAAPALWLSRRGDDSRSAFRRGLDRKDHAADANYLYERCCWGYAEDRAAPSFSTTPRGCAKRTEKLYALNFPGAIPRQIVTYE